MKKIYTLILLIALCCLASCKSAEQSDAAVKAQQADSITLNKGNLLLLIERANFAINTFDGRSSKDANFDDYFDNEQLGQSFVFTQKGKSIPLTPKALSKISSDNIEDIEMSMDGSRLVIFGKKGKVLGVVTKKLPQLKPEIAPNNTSVDEGNYQLLVERIYIASKAFKTGQYGIRKPIARPYVQGGGIPASAMLEIPLTTKFENGKTIRIDLDRLSKTPKDSIESLTIGYSPIYFANHGSDALYGNIIFKFKGEN